jgi:hypothetical protein
METMSEGRTRRNGGRRCGRLLAGLAAAGAGLVLLPSGRGFVLTGESLALDQRDVRVFDNFSDPEAHLNQTPDPSFPGFLGAELALWKAVTEWGSEPHFEGRGDPHQPGDLGSGGADFDAVWQGRAPDPGGTNDNVMSEISGNGAGTLAFTETPTGNGWRIRFYRTPWIWFDDPFGSTATAFHSDLQAVATHEYGHALGLDHTMVSGATMTATALPDDTIWRSIEPDDVAGIQAIYGARSAGKPHVSTYAHLGGGLLRIEGERFDPSSNEVWFTRAGSAGDGTPVAVTGLASTLGGKRIELALPAGAGPGDLLVKLPGTAHSALSNAFPFDPGADPCPGVKAYGTGKVSSAGQPAEIRAQGAPSLAAGSFRLELRDAPSGEPAILFWGLQPQARPFYGGWLLVRGPLRRAARFNLDVFGFGSASVPITAPMVGLTRYYQYWFRDLNGPRKAGTSNALEVVFCP